jgi:ABC-type bacteriocin/lantibiotic exporter with double-glycine peptidase domain
VENENRDQRKELPLGEGAIGIEFKNVYFSYKDRDVPVLSGLNMKIQPGQFAALVGASGCGKSTIVSLLEKYVAPLLIRPLYFL